MKSKSVLQPWKKSAKSPGLLEERQEACLRALKLQNSTDREAWEFRLAPLHKAFRAYKQDQRSSTQAWTKSSKYQPIGCMSDETQVLATLHRKDQHRQKDREGQRQHVVHQASNSDLESQAGDNPDE